MNTEQRNLSGWVRQEPDTRDLQFTRTLTPEILPESYILPTPDIYDQGNEGSCVDNSAAYCFRIVRKQFYGDWLFEPSRAFLYFNARLIGGLNINLDSGSTVRDGFKALSKWGVCSDTDFPYVAGDFAKAPEPNLYKKAAKNSVTEYQAVDQILNDIKSAVYLGRPVSFGFDVYESFMKGNWPQLTGIMPLPFLISSDKIIGGHCVTIVGWDTNKAAVLCLNSWGKEWGLGGLFYMPYIFLLSGDCADFWCLDKVVCEAPPPAPAIDPKIVNFLQMVFTQKSYLSSLKERPLVSIGLLLGLDCDMKYSFSKNLESVSKYLKI